MTDVSKEQLDQAAETYKKMVDLCQGVQNGLVLQILANVAADTIVHSANGDATVIKELTMYLARNLSEFIPVKEAERIARERVMREIPTRQ